MTSGERVRNTYATYPELRDSPEKFGLIPYNIKIPHGFLIKVFRFGIGMRPISLLVR